MGLEESCDLTGPLPRRKGKGTSWPASLLPEHPEEQASGRGLTPEVVHSGLLADQGRVQHGRPQTGGALQASCDLPGCVVYAQGRLACASALLCCSEEEATREKFTDFF